MRSRRITENSVVRLKREFASKRHRATATVIAWIGDVEGGVIVSPALEGLRCWNVEHLEHVPAPKPRNAHPKAAK